MLPVERLPLDEVQLKLYQATSADGSDDDVVVLLKRTKTVFDAHREDHYRDKGSKRNDFVNPHMKYPQDKELKKFWPRRYYLFSKFDRGVLIDDESWYSVTPEPMAKHIAAKVNERLVNADDPQDRVPDG